LPTSPAKPPFDLVYQLFDSKDASFQALIAAQEHALRTRVALALAAGGAIPPPEDR
jgi:hypothetical protein